MKSDLPFRTVFASHLDKLREAKKIIEMHRERLADHYSGQYIDDTIAGLDDMLSVLTPARAT